MTATLLNCLLAIGTGLEEDKVRVSMSDDGLNACQIFEGMAN